MPFDPEQYDSWYDTHASLFRAELEAIKRHYRDCPAPSLEVGVGTGRFASPLGVDYGIDPDENMLSLANMRGVKVVKGVGEELPFQSEYFGTVLFITSLSFLRDAERALAEASRVLKLGGCLIIAFIPKNSYFGKKYASLAEKGDLRFRNTKFFSYSDISKLIPNIFRFEGAYSTLIGEEKQTDILYGVHSNASFVVLKYKKCMDK